MIHLDLDNQEKQALSTALKSYLSDMSYEIADTDKKEFRDDLKATRDLLKKVLDAVDQAIES